MLVVVCICYLVNNVKSEYTFESLGVIVKKSLYSLAMSGYMFCAFNFMVIGIYTLKLYASMI